MSFTFLLKAGKYWDFVLTSSLSQLRSNSIWSFNGFYYIYSSSKYLLSIYCVHDTALETGIQQWSVCVSLVVLSEGTLVVMEATSKHIILNQQYHHK